MLRSNLEYALRKTGFVEDTKLTLRNGACRVFINHNTNRVNFSDGMTVAYQIDIESIKQVLVDNLAGMLIVRFRDDSEEAFIF